MRILKTVILATGVVFLGVSSAAAQVTPPSTAGGAPIPVEWPPKQISDINVDPIDRDPKIPPDSSGQLMAGADPQHWFNAQYPYYCKTWNPPGIVYNPLYFEDPRLERNGCARFHLNALESTRAAVRFGGQFIALPYNMFVAPPHRCENPPAVNQCGQAVSARQHILYQH